MAERLYRVTGVAKFHLPPKASDEAVAQAVVDIRRWKREHGNDAEIGSAFDAPVTPGAPRGDSAEFWLHANNVEANTLSSAVTHGLMTLRARLQGLGRHSDDAYQLHVEATSQRVRVGDRG